MKRFSLSALALFSALSLSACAQSATSAQSGDADAKSSADVVKIATTQIVAGTPEARVRDALVKLNPALSIDRIGPAPFTGFREVVAGGQVLYVSDDGTYLIQGGLLDLVKRKDLSEQAMAKVRGDVLKTIPVRDRIVYSPAGAPKYTVVVLTDIECGFCRKLHNDMAEYTKRGIQIEYLAFPRAGIGSKDYRDMVSVWCADDRRKALTDAKNGRSIPAKSCTNPVNMQYAAGVRMGLGGTPMILSTTGDLLSGYLPPDALEQRLEKLAADRAASTKDS